MSHPPLRFLCDCIAEALLAHYDVKHLPVPMREILNTPPPDLVKDLGLVETLPYGDALWLRPSGGQASVFVNPHISEPEKRYAMARALFIGLCATDGGKAAGLPPAPNDQLIQQGNLFARRLLMSPSLLPAGWEDMPPDCLADLCGVPPAIAAVYQEETARPSAGRTSR